MNLFAAGVDNKQVLRAAEHKAKPAFSARHDAPLCELVAEPVAHLLIAHEPYHPRSEKIRALRTELLLRRQLSDSAYMIALLSPGRREGRSLLAAELAIAFAQLNRPTLLVDADFRNPTQHCLFGLENDRGLSQAIGLEFKPRPYSVRHLPHLSLLTAGDIPDNPLELLLNPYFAELLDDWRNTFEFVLIDTAPVTRFSDGLTIANQAGNVLALSRAQKTGYAPMQNMLRRLTATRSELLGAVINHF